MTRQVVLWRGLLLLGIGLTCACEQRAHAPGVTESWDNVCVDMDGDGFGMQCGRGDDCDDGDQDVHDSCASCVKPADGCACEASAEPVDCRLPYTLSGGSLLCHTGTRYCRDGAWSGCEGIVTYSVSPPVRTLSSRALFDPGSAPGDCSICSPDCKRITDPLNTPFDADAGVGSRVESVVSGGVTVAWDAPVSGSLPPPFPGRIDDAPCAGDDVGDCDGLPPPFDPNPAQKPSDTSHQVMFVNLPSGTSSTRRFQAKLPRRGPVDLYLYVDSTGSMESVLSVLRSQLRSGSLLPAALASADCVDADGDGMPDNAKKTGGIVGNIGCLVGDVQFGTGWFRELPFLGPISGIGPFSEINQKVAPWDTEVFDHVVDISADTMELQTALDRYRVRLNLNVPEAHMQGLWTVATGGELNLGWNKPGVAARNDCAADRFGYPCFRRDALPVVLMFTDAPMESGPPTADPGPPAPALSGDCLSTPNFADRCHPRDYPSEILMDELQLGSEDSYRELTTTAESYALPEPVGVIDGKLLTYIGNTSKMAADVILPTPPGPGECIPWDDDKQLAPDVVFRFEVAAAAGGDFILSGRGSHFDTSLLVQKIDPGGGPPELVACSDDQVELGEELERKIAPEVEVHLEQGEYFAVLKGFSQEPFYEDRLPIDKGWFQFTLGQRSAERANRTFEPKLWAGRSSTELDGVREVLVDKGIHVITIQSGNDAFAEYQALTLASATMAVNSLGAPLHGAIGTDGSGLGEEVVRVVSELVRNTKRDVSLDLGNTPGQPNPGFGFTVTAIKQPGDGCDGVVNGDGDAMGIPDTFEGCEPGATPEFAVTFTNPPASGAVPANPADPNGGYFMAARVLGDGVAELDRVLVYARPLGGGGPPMAVHYASGSYDQEIRANGCEANEGPVWGALGWNATLPPGTRITFEACAVDTRDQLPGCTFREAFTLRPGVPCSSSLDCGGEGACPQGADSVCQMISGPMCMVDTDCGAFGTCGGDSGGSTCTNTAERLDLHPIAQQNMQGRRFGRVRATLVSSTDRTQAPTLLRWTLDYTCAPRE